LIDSHTNDINFYSSIYIKMMSSIKSLSTRIKEYCSTGMDH